MFSPQDIDKDLVSSSLSKTISVLTYVGENFVNLARNTKTYRDQTGNLRSSIGYTIAINGNIEKENLSGNPEGVSHAKDIAEEIVKAADEIDSFLIIIGTHGASGFEAFWVGSNAYKIVSATERPIITIRGGVDISRSIQRVVLPIDSTLETRQKVPMTALIAKYFEAEIHLLAVYTTVFKDVRQRVDEYVQQVERYLVENEVKYVSEHLEAENITESTIDYATKINANLISIMDEQERKASNLWLGPYAQQMINQSPVPVLCIHARNVIAGVSR